MNLSELVKTLHARRAEISGLNAVTGFDGFVDEMITVVGERHGSGDFTRVEDIASFGQLILAAAGQSSLREIVVTRADLGGCAINMGDGLAELGASVSTFATVGDPPHAAFSEHAGKARLHPWGCQPGRTLAYEFADGKLMFSSVSHLAELTPAVVNDLLENGVFYEACRGARLIALTDWTLYPHMTACWHLLQEKIFARLPHRPFFFLDLVDPSSRSAADIREMLALLPSFELCGPTVLGLNQNEANILARLAGGVVVTQSSENIALPPQVVEQANLLREWLGISEVVIHGQRYAVVSTREGCFETSGPYCATPVKSTGAGDRFNAGYALGLMLQLPPQNRLQLGAATSGVYVRLGRSGRLQELIDFLESWHRGKC